MSNDGDPLMRYEIWRLVDRWMYQGLHDMPEDQKNDAFKQSKRKYTSKRNLTLSQPFTVNLTHLSQIGNFTSLITKLLTPLESSKDPFTKFSLLFPCDLGLGYRLNNYIGVWPYIEFLMIDVLPTHKILVVQETVPTCKESF